MKKQIIKTITSLLLILICLSGCARSDNEDALEYRNGKCIAFYPANSEKIKEYAKSLCESGEEYLFDYKVNKAGDYYGITYDDGRIFYVDDRHLDIELKVKDGEKMLSDMLRYEMKKDEIDKAYTSSFWVDTDKDALDLENIDIKIDGDMIDLYFKDFDYTLSLTAGYLKTLTGKDLGFGEITEYEKKEYISINRPMVALTYDDGPYRKVDEVIYETLSKYGAKATFYSVGDRMSQNELENIQEGIELGMEYGSHTNGHENLSKLDLSEARFTVMDPANYVHEKLGYKMNTYRPPYGSRNYELEEIIGMPAILWSVDTKDWANRDETLTYENAINDIKDGDIILMHSLYMSSANATKKIVPELMDQGFQLVTVSELLTYKGYDLTTLKSYGHN